MPLLSSLLLEAALAFISFKLAAMDLSSHMFSMHASSDLSLATDTLLARAAPHAGVRATGAGYLEQFSAEQGTAPTRCHREGAG